MTEQQTAVTFLMAREIIIDVMKEHESEINSVEDLADLLLREEKREYLFVDGWDNNVDKEPFDGNKINNKG
ncbi:hypothetical protein AAGG74_15995 [Bacillus mexicanus]|uniref:hypothetical protein n=1 Tax=Bacillus mexicanus TaxID=2834415 RepID=UPI003D243F6D